MNTLFLVPYPEDKRTNNLYRKFTSQIECAQKISNEVFYTSFDMEKIYINKYGDESYKRAIGKTTAKNRNFYQMHYIMLAIRKWIDYHTVDVVYMRSITPTNVYAKTLESIKNNNTKIVVEIPTYPGFDESKNSKRKIFFFAVKIMNWMFQRAYQKNVSLYTLIGEPAEKYKNCPAINIQNGLNVDNMPLKNGFAEHSSELHFLVVAVLSYWHGYDRLLIGLKEYYQSNGANIKVILHICGKSYDGSLEQLKKYTKDNNLQEYVVFHGFIMDNELNSLYDQCDLAIGSLGLHRQNINIDTTLKLPEYIARGVPFVYCKKNESIENCSFCLRIESNDDPVKIERLIRFFESVDKGIVIEEMRKYAKNHLDWSIQFCKVINALN